MKEKELEDYFIDTIEHISESCYWGEIERFERQYILPIALLQLTDNKCIYLSNGTKNNTT